MDLHSKQLWRKPAFMGVFLALAMICSYIEMLIPFDFGIPGVKLGLTNIVVVLMLYSIGTKEAFCVSVIRIFLVGILFGNLIGILYSLGGGILSFLVMALLKKGNHLGCISVSVAGGIAHNIGQILIAALVVQPLCVVLFSGTSDCRTSYGISDRASCTGTDRASAFSDRKISRVEHLFA